MIKSKMLPYSGFVLASFFILLVMVNDASALEKTTLEFGPPQRAGDIIIDLIKHDWSANPWKDGVLRTSTTTITQAEIDAGMNSDQKAEKIKNQILADCPDLNVVRSGSTLTITSNDVNNPEVNCPKLLDGTGQYAHKENDGIEEGGAVSPIKSGRARVN